MLPVGGLCFDRWLLGGLARDEHAKKYAKDFFETANVVKSTPQSFFLQLAELALMDLLACQTRCLRWWLPSCPQDYDTATSA